jgi:hypothetical protein
MPAKPAPDPADEPTVDAPDEPPAVDVIKFAIGGIVPGEEWTDVTEYVRLAHTEHGNYRQALDGYVPINETPEE